MSMEHLNLGLGFNFDFFFLDSKFDTVFFEITKHA